MMAATFIAGLSKMFSSGQNDEECDTTDDDPSINSGQ